MPTPSPSIPVFVWKDVVFVVSSGRTQPKDFDLLADLVIEQTRQYPGGVGCIVIVPKDATPPSDASRKALNGALGKVEGSLRGICWLVEGDGFQGAMVQAVVTGLRLRKPRLTYATNVCTNVNEALAWVLCELPGPHRRESDVSDALVAMSVRRPT